MSNKPTPVKVDRKPDIGNKSKDNTTPRDNNSRNSNGQGGSGRRGNRGGGGGQGHGGGSRDGGGERNERRGGGGDRSGGGGGPEHHMREKLSSSGGSTVHLQTKEGRNEPKKFTGRCRLFIGNLSNSVTEAEFRKMFEQYGEIAELFLNVSKGFGFVKLDTREHAEAAKAGLDFSLQNGKYLRVRFATHGAALRVKHLTPWISNELLEAAFSNFGDVERAIVIVDDRGRPVGEGIVEFSRKQAAQLALKRCTEGCFLITGSPRPVHVEILEQRDEEDGLPEKNFQKNNPQYMHDREKGPRLADQGSFEYEFATRWKKLYEVERQKRARLEAEIEEGRQALEDQQEYAVYEHQANVLREKLRAIEEQNNLFQRDRELSLSRRNQEERRREEQRAHEEAMIRQQEEEILRRRNMGGMGEEMRRRQEDSMMMQASALSDILDRQEAALRGGFEMGPNGPQGPNKQQQMMMQQRGMGMNQQRPGNQGPGGPGMNMGGGGGGNPRMGGPQMGGGNRGGGSGGGNGGQQREMMERRREMEEYGMDPKRRRF